MSNEIQDKFMNAILIMPGMLDELKFRHRIIESDHIRWFVYKKTIIGNISIEIIIQYCKENDCFLNEKTSFYLNQNDESSKIPITKMWELMQLINLLTGEKTTTTNENI